MRTAAASLGAAALTAAAALTFGAPRAVAAPDPTTTSTSTTTPDETTTTAPTPDTVPLPAPPAGPTGPAATAAPPDAGGEAPTEAPPDGVAVPLPATPAAPTPAGVQVGRTLSGALPGARRAAARADTVLARVVAEATRVEAEYAGTEQRLADVEQRRADVVARLRAIRARVVSQAVAAYTGGNLARIDNLLTSRDVNAAIRRAGLLDGVVAEGRRTVRAYEQARREAGGLLSRLVDRAAQQGAAAALARSRADAATKDATDRHVGVAALEMGSRLAIEGFVFPVGAPHRFSDDFGAPRNVGTPYEHTHQGTDVFAEPGAPLVACERGVVTRVGQDLLGGTKLWIVGQSGTRYYYAHLSGFAPGLADGLVVDAGTLVGFVGNTGDAQGGPTHLHFEIHPEGGPAVDPYFLLAAVDAVDRITAANRPVSG